MEGPMERDNDVFWIQRKQSGNCSRSMESSVSEGSSQCVSRGCGSHTAATQEKANRVTAARGLHRRHGGQARADQLFGEGGGGGCYRRSGGGGGGGENAGGGGGEDGNICDQTAKVLGIAFLSIAQTVARTEEGMRHLEMKMEKTDEAVRSMSQGLEEHGKRMERLEERLNNLEQRMPSWATGPRDRPPPMGPAVGVGSGPGGPGGPGGPCGPGGQSPPRYPSCRHSTSSSALLSASSARPRPRPGGPSRSLSSTCNPAAPHQHLHQQQQQQQQQGTPMRSCCMERFSHLGRHLLKMAHEGSAKDVRKLLDDGADVNFRNSSKWTPLHRAAAKGRADVVALLLSRGADVNARTSYGFSPLHTAACNDYTGQCVALLLGAWPEVDGQDRSLRTPLHYAAAYGNEAATRALLAAGASRTSRDDEGWTPLDVARADFIRRLLII